MLPRNVNAIALVVVVVLCAAMGWGLRSQGPGAAGNQKGTYRGDPNHEDHAGVLSRNLNDLAGVLSDNTKRNLIAMNQRFERENGFEVWLTTALGPTSDQERLSRELAPRTLIARRCPDSPPRWTSGNPPGAGLYLFIVVAPDPRLVSFRLEVGTEASIEPEVLQALSGRLNVHLTRCDYNEAVGNLLAIVSAELKSGRIHRKIQTKVGATQRDLPAL